MRAPAPVRGSSRASQPASALDPAHKYSTPIPFVRPALRRRIEAFSPKIGRRLSLGGYDAYRTWLAIEANPAITTFCERPAFVEGPGSAIVDFWVQLRGSPTGEFWFIESRRATKASMAAGDDASMPVPVRLHGVPTRQVLQAALRSWEVPITNWGRMLPYITSYRRWRDALLEQSIVVFLANAQPLDAVLARFDDHDTTAVEAALFTLVAQGRVLSPDLALTLLSGRTRFQRS